MKMKRLYGKAFKAVLMSGIAAAAMFAARVLSRKKGRSREIPVE